MAIETLLGCFRHRIGIRKQSCAIERLPHTGRMTIKNVSYKRYELWLSKRKQAGV